MFPPQTDSDDFARYTDSNVIFTSGPMDMSIPADAFGFQQQNAGQDAFASSMGFVEPPMYAEAPNYMINNRASPSMYTDESPDMRLPSSSLSTASAPSAASSAIGSPQSNHGQMGAMPEWAPQGLGLQPTIVGNDYMGSDFSSFPSSGMEELSFEFPTAKAFVDPSLIHPEITRPPMGIPPYDAHFQQPNQTYPTSPSASSSSPQPHMMRTNSSSPFMQTGPFQSAFPSSPYGAPMDKHIRAPSISQFVPPTPGEYSSDESNKQEKQRCTWPDCGKTFKDLKAHMLTHQNERPEKCPIQTCEYHTKGFARKYDKNRHTLTHYKGTMVCGFCPGSGSAAEKSFNRADVFKRHLTAVHGVEQTPPNSRKKSAASANSGKKLSGYAPDATGKCSTCSQTFANAQDFYEHLDDCVLRIVQQEDPAEAINAKRLAEVENDKDVHQTLEKNNLPTTTDIIMKHDDDDDVDSGDEDNDSSPGSNPSPTNRKKGNPANGVQKSRGVTHSRGGVTLNTKIRSRKNRRDYPSSWGFDKGQMTMKKRVMAVFDGPRRLAKDDMMLSTDHEIRIKLADGKSYVTDLDVRTLERAAGFHGATEEEKGPWISDDPTAEQLNEMQQMLSNTTHTL
ncbi:hypothetical protein NW762_006788 [Fusarium torreyae]|uniref:C2H2-type domain-containing protein n=1 Tax=Fusarium torreyae TaxID=1237075 RepID=A0A9W8VF51_9HYPO|nr:hypothetical protein NW762_006788 [Fusarium torreyae]